MSLRCKGWLVALAMAAGVDAAAGEPAPGDAPGLAPFDGQVRAILVGKCLSCHSPDSKKGGLDLSRRDGALAGGDGGEAFVPGQADESLLFEKVAAGEMPPKNPLTGEQVEAFRAWIEAGAPYRDEPLKAPRAGPDWWSLRKIERPEPPAVADPSAVANPIDAFVLARLEEQGLAPAPEADRATLIRRLSFDLIGLPPTPEEVAAFVADPAEDAYERLVDRLLDSPHYGERWGRHWLDAVRFGESEGYETNLLRPNAWPYRDYVIRAFNRDTPLPEFILEQLAGDTLPDGDWLTRAATGFLVGGSHDIVGNATIEARRQQRMDDLDDMITATSTAFLGLTANCARCHDHKFDPISQKDYYGLQAIFAGVHHGEREVEAPDAEGKAREAGRVRGELARVEQRLDRHEPPARPEGDAPVRPAVHARRNVERFDPVEARAVRLTILATNDANNPCLDELEVYASGPSPRNVALASAGGRASASSEIPGAAIHKVAHLNDGRHGNGRSWISDSPGKGWARIDLPEPVAIDRVVWGRDREETYADRLAIAYYLEVETEPGRWRVVASSADREPYKPGAKGGGPAGPASDEVRTLRDERDALRARLGSLGPTVRVYAGNFKPPGVTHLLRRGDPMQEGDVVPPSVFAAVRPKLEIAADAPEPERRRALAKWLGHPENPLPARVMVNRVWHHHFGRGLVATPGDFGFNGAPPTHPLLLDWLADEYRRGGYRLKPLHRLILRSAAYRRSTRPDPSALAVDAKNERLWRMSPRRLEAEPIRDAILAVGGNLDRRAGGPGYSLWEKSTNYVAVYKPREALGPDAFRRMVYQLKPRSQQDPTFGAFDCPDAALVAPRRNVSTTALQALNLLNSRFLLDQADAFAARVREEAGADPRRQADRAFLLAFGRPPTAPESTAAADLIRDHGAAALCRALYNANEFVYVP